MPDNLDPADVIRARIAVLEAERERLGEEIGKLEHALRVLTDHGQDVNTSSMKMTPAQRRQISKGARTREGTLTETEAFAAAISKPHAGGQGYSMRSLAEAIKVSHQYFSSVFKGDFCVSYERAELVHKLTGYRFPSNLVAAKK